MVIDLDKLKQSWEYISIVLALVVALTYFVIENKQANKTIEELSNSNKSLTEKVQKLEGHTEGVDHAIQLFMENPPGLIKYRVEVLEKKVFGASTTSSTDETKEIAGPPAVNK